MRLRIVALGAWMASAACAPVATAPVSPGPPGPPPRVEPTRVELAVPHVAVERPEEGTDPILHSPWLLDPAFEAEVDRWVVRYTGPDRRAFETWLRRMTAWSDLVDTSLARRALPTSLRYLPLAESGYTPAAVSHASAVGLWQLMSPTARAAGLRVGELVDERRDPERATAAAVAYLDELHRRFGSWFLALAAYNAGPTRVERLLAEHADGRAGSDGLYWHIRPHLPRETRHFVPRFVALARLAADPGAHGFALPGPAASSWDDVEVPDATSLDVVAAAAGVSETEVALLNPQILRRVTPRGVPTRLRVPGGTGERFAVEYARVPPEERVSATEHRVAKGETLWGIARRYGIALDTLEEANPSIRPERLQPGDRLLVPMVPVRGRGAGGR